MGWRWGSVERTHLEKEGRLFYILMKPDYIDFLLVSVNSLEEDTDPTGRNVGLRLSVQSEHQTSCLRDVPKLRGIPERISRPSALMQQ